MTNEEIFEHNLKTVFWVKYGDIDWTGFKFRSTIDDDFIYTVTSRCLTKKGENGYSWVIYESITKINTIVTTLQLYQEWVIQLMENLK